MWKINDHFFLLLLNYVLTFVCMFVFIIRGVLKLCLFVSLINTFTIFLFCFCIHFKIDYFLKKKLKWQTYLAECGNFMEKVLVNHETRIRKIKLENILYFSLSLSILEKSSSGKKYSIRGEENKRNSIIGREIYDI